MYPEEKPVIWLVIIETAESFYVEMKTVDKCTFRAVTNNYLQELRSLLVLSDNWSGIFYNPAPVQSRGCSIKGILPYVTVPVGKCEGNKFK